MNLNAKFLTAAIATSIIMTAVANPANAICFNPGCLIRDTQTTIDRTVNYTVKIRNSTNSTINYAFEGIPRAPIAPGYEVTWTGATVGAPSVSFDNGRHQQVTHGLSRQGSYHFMWESGTLALYSD